MRNFIYTFSEVYFQSGVEPSEFQKQLEYQLRKLTLGVSVGLVKGREPEFPNAFNPYSHFIPNLRNVSNKVKTSKKVSTLKSTCYY